MFVIKNLYLVFIILVPIEFWVCINISIDGLHDITKIIAYLVCVFWISTFCILARLMILEEYGLKFKLFITKTLLCILFGINTGCFYTLFDRIPIELITICLTCFSVCFLYKYSIRLFKLRRITIFLPGIGEFEHPIIQSKHGQLHCNRACR